MSATSQLLGPAVTVYGTLAVLAGLMQARQMLTRHVSCEASVRFLASYVGGYVIWLLYGQAGAGMDISGLEDEFELSQGLRRRLSSRLRRLTGTFAWPDCPDRAGSIRFLPDLYGAHAWQMAADGLPAAHGDDTGLAAYNAYLQTLASSANANGEKRERRKGAMAYGHAERNLALLRQLEAETHQLLESLNQPDPEQSAWLQEVTSRGDEQCEGGAR
jgi:hypothetical protein